MSSAQIIQLVMRPVETGQASAHDGRVVIADLYDLASIELDRYRGLILGTGSDQRFLKRHAPLLESWVQAGGRLLYSGHPVEPFLDGMPSWRKLHFRGIEDIWLTALDPHPIWEGIDRRDLLLRTGVPGSHSFEELLRIGVGGFYARNYLADLPQSTRAITGIGPGRLPVDVSYPMGKGEVIVHCGNDLTATSQQAGTSIEHFTERILTYMESGRA